MSIFRAESLCERQRKSVLLLAKADRFSSRAWRVEMRWEWNSAREGPIAVANFFIHVWCVNDLCFCGCVFIVGGVTIMRAEGKNVLIQKYAFFKVFRWRTPSAMANCASRSQFILFDRLFGPREWKIWGAEALKRRFWLWKFEALLWFGLPLCVFWDKSSLNCFQAAT